MNCLLFPEVNLLWISISLCAVVGACHAHGWCSVLLDELHFLQSAEGDGAVVLIGDFYQSAAVNHDAVNSRAVVVFQVGAERVDAEAACRDKCVVIKLIKACSRKLLGLESAFQGEAAGGLLGCGDGDGDVCGRSRGHCRKREAGGICLVPEQIRLASHDVFNYRKGERVVFRIHVVDGEEHDSIVVRRHERQGYRSPFAGFKRAVVVSLGERMIIIHLIADERLVAVGEVEDSIIQISTWPKSFSAHYRQRIKCYSCQGIAIAECMLANARHTSRDVD